MKVTMLAVNYNLDVSDFQVADSEAVFLIQLENSRLCMREFAATSSRMSAYDKLSSLNVTDTDIPNDTTVIDTTSVVVDRKNKMSLHNVGCSLFLASLPICSAVP